MGKFHYYRKSVVAKENATFQPRFFVAGNYVGKITDTDELIEPRSTMSSDLEPYHFVLLFHLRHIQCSDCPESVAKKEPATSQG